MDRITAHVSKWGIRTVVITGFHTNIYHSENSSVCPVPNTTGIVATVYKFKCSTESDAERAINMVVINSCVTESFEKKHIMELEFPDIF